MRCQWAGASQSVYLEIRIEQKGVRFPLDGELVQLHFIAVGLSSLTLHDGVEKIGPLIKYSVRNLTVQIAP